MSGEKHLTYDDLHTVVSTIVDAFDKRAVIHKQESMARIDKLEKVQGSRLDSIEKDIKKIATVAVLFEKHDEEGKFWRGTIIGLAATVLLSLSGVIWGSAQIYQSVVENKTICARASRHIEQDELRWNIWKLPEVEASETD